MKGFEKKALKAQERWEKLKPDLERMYYTEQKSGKEIAEFAGMSMPATNQAMRRMGMKHRGPASSKGRYQREEYEPNVPFTVKQFRQLLPDKLAEPVEDTEDNRVEILIL